jgi:hypothetical protein
METVWLICLSVAVGLLLVAALPPFPRWRFRRGLDGHAHSYGEVSIPKYGDGKRHCTICGSAKPGSGQ